MLLLACLLCCAGHPNIVRLQDVYETTDAIFIVQELCPGRTLMDVIKAQAPMREDLAASLFRGVVKSVLHCHQVGARTLLYTRIVPEYARHRRTC